MFFSTRNIRREILTTGNNARRNAANTTCTANKYYKGEIETFVVVLAFRYEKLELKKSFDVFIDNLINYMIKELNNSEDVIVIIQDLVDPKAYFDANNKSKNIVLDESKSELKKKILAARVRQYI